MNDIGEWIDHSMNDNSYWYIKRLSGNDTQLSGHQAGPYIPKNLVFELFPTLLSSKELNPRVDCSVKVVSHIAPERDIKAIWYNNKLSGGTRNECRLTGWGGNDSPILNPESTGSICLFCFNKPKHKQDSQYCQIWLCDSLREEDIVENVFGNIEPGRFVVQYGKDEENTERTSCTLSEELIPENWIETFPSGAEIILKSISLKPELRKHNIDKRLLARRECEFEVFMSIEKHWTLPQVTKGFNSVDEFIKLANSISNRRKSRAGRSLELQTKIIFEEEGLVKFSHDQISEGKKRPDFIFPSIEDYHDKSFDPKKLRMLGAKTTCKDRWRQILSEADKIETKHLLTLQEGVSINQFSEMEKEGIVLVVPEPIHKSFPTEIRPKLETVSSFISQTKELYCL